MEGGRRSVGEGVFVVGHRVQVVARFVGAWTRNRLGKGLGRRVMPGAEMAQDLLDDAWVVNDCDDPHGILADGATQRIGVPDLQDEVAPALGGQFEWRWRGEVV